MAKKFTYRGKTIEELKTMSIKEFAELLPSRQRRKVLRGFTEEEKKLLKKIEKRSRNLKTHCRSMIVLPNMVGLTIKIYRGNDFVPIIIIEEMVGHYFGELVLTRKRVEHSAPGIGATKSSSSVSVK